MKLTTYFYLVFIFSIFMGCKDKKNANLEVEKILPNKSEFTIAFGSCNNQLLPNLFWDDILDENPDVWLWGGDVIYSDTDDMTLLQKNYDLQNAHEGYAKFKEAIEIHGTWDDHDYGMNDGGSAYTHKSESQQLFLDFLGVSKDSPRRQREGIHFQKDFNFQNGSIKIIVLDTRYFRSDLIKDTITDKRYVRSTGGTMLGKSQWDWLEKTLASSQSDFNIILSSIQFLSYEHGYESWGNMPDEVEKMEKLLRSAGIKNVIFLSGDRHISEFSKKDVAGLSYPLIDFTSSGMTHSYSGFKGEPNQFRIGKVVSDKSYGLLKVNLDTKSVDFLMKGENDFVFEKHTQNYAVINSK